MYELGALRALDEALDGLDGLDLTRLDCYVGISSGAFLAAGLANRMSTAEMCRIFITGTSDDVDFRPETFVRPAFMEYLRRASGLPRLAASGWRDLLFAPRDARWSDLITRFGGLVPTGLFDNREVERFLREVFERRGRSNDFRELGRPLHVVAVDLDSGDAVRFGGPGWDDVPISRAVQASAALPGLYPPVEIPGIISSMARCAGSCTRRWCWTRASTCCSASIRWCRSTHAPKNGGKRDPLGLAGGGLPAVLSQTFRTLLQSRMQIGLAKYAQQYPDVDQLVFEPNAADGELFFTNLFSFSARHRVCQLAYRNTLADLRARAPTLRPLLATHGIRLRDEIIHDGNRSILDDLDDLDVPPRMTETTARLRRALDEVDQVVARQRVQRRSARS